MKWEEKRLCDYIDILSGFAFKTEDFVDYGIPIIKIKNIQPPMVTLNDLTFVSKEIAQMQTRYLLSYNDVLIAMTGSHINQWASVVGRVARVKFRDKTLLNQRVGKVTIKKNAEANIDYVYYYLSQDTVKTELASKAGGAANQANISPSQIKELKFPCPSLAVQEKIAVILRSYDNLIENNQKQIKLLEETAQRLYKEWFIDLHFPGYEDTKIVDGVPQGWHLKSMAQIGDFLNGFAFKPSDWQEAGLPIIKIKEMGNGISKDTPRNIGGRVPNKYLIKSGDILFSWSATLMAMIWNEEDGWLNQHLFKVTPCMGIGREFMLQSIKCTIEEFKNLTTGSTMKHIQRGKLDQVSVVVPSREVMNRYNCLADNIREQILRLSKKSVFLQESRDRLLPKLMSGELEV